MHDDAAVDDAAVVARLRAAGCVWAEEEASLLSSAARSPAELDALVERRAAGEPIEQLVGWAEFCGLRILVDPGVFVPRRRSEFLVSVAVAFARAATSVAAPDSDVSDMSLSPSGGHAALGALRREAPPVIVDLCCGTGALGLAVATGRGGTTELHASDLDPAAVACARRNVAPTGGRVYLGDLFGALPEALRGRVDVLICNAPYVPSTEIPCMPAEARDHEALMALDGGSDGLAVLRRAAAGAPDWLAPGGLLLVETGDRQAPEMAAAMAGAGLSPAIHTDDDSGATVVTGQLHDLPQTSPTSP